ncbi:MAG: T9SS type A sorting domain-containing protein [bacterium]
MANYTFVTLKVYDNLGREVAVLFNGYKDKGKYFATFDGSNFSSGIYYYKIVIDNYIQIKKMLLLK